MSCNSLIQPHFDFACCACYLNLPMSLKNRLQTAQNVCTRFCLGMERGSHIGINHFENINWLPIKNGVVYVRCIYSKFFSGSKTRRSVESFVEPIYMKEISRKSISYLGTKFGMA